MAKFELKMDEICDAYDHRDDSPVKQQEYMVLMWEQLERLVTQRALQWGSKVKGNPHASLDDLKSSAKVEIIEHINDYDPHRTNPSTYFSRFIDDAMKACTNSRILQVSNHYIYGGAEVDKVLRENGYDGLQDPRVTVKLITQIMDIPTKKASVILENSKRSFCSLDDPSWIEDTVGESPEDKVMKNESIKTLVEACSTKLTPLEQYLIEQFFVNDITSSRLLVSGLRKNKSLLKRFSLNPKQVTGKFVIEIKNRAVNKLRAVSENRRSNALVNAAIYEQASSEDLLEAFVPSPEVVTI